MEKSGQLDAPGAVNRTAGLDATPCQKVNIVFTDVSKERSASLNTAV
jgi:hypothetical protein